jgi:hypothetical protein
MEEWMMLRNAVTAVVVSAGLLVLGACGADDDDDSGGAGLTAFMPVGPGGVGGVGGVVVTAGVGGIPPLAGVGGAAGASGMGGMGGAGGSGGMGGAGSGGSGAPPTGAIAMLSGVGGQTLTGVAMFALSGMNVDLVITLTACTNGIYPLHIHDATSCDNAASLGEHWGGTRGEGIPAIVCDGNAGMQTHTRMAAVAEKKWTIGTSAADDLIGHVVVLHGASGPIACGVIKGQ